MKSKIWSVMSGVAVASLLGGVNPASAADPPNFKPTIAANPTTLTLEATTLEGTDQTGKTTLTYNAGKKHPYVEVWVSVNGAKPKKFFEDEGDGKGTHTITVEMGKKYRYILTDFGKELASVEVVTKIVGKLTTPDTGGINTSKPVGAAPIKVEPAKKPAASTRAIVCSPVDWVQVDLDAGLSWFGRDVPAMRELPETKDSLTAMLKKHGFETQHRRVEGTGGSVKVHLFARLTKESRTANTAVTERRDREVKAIAGMVYGGAKAVGKKVYATK